MTDPQVDVNIASVPSANAGVPAAPPAAAPDVKPLSKAPSAEETPPVAQPSERPHEESVPYERFSEVNEKLKLLQLELDAARAQEPQEPEPTNGQIDWAALGLQAPQPYDQPQQAPQYTAEQLEEQIREGMYARPLATMQPIIQQYAQETVRQELQKMTQVRRIPDFQKFESGYYKIPDEIVYQAQANPEVIRYLIAKHQATLQGTVPPPAPASMQKLPPSSAPAPAQPAKTMAELQAQWELAGEKKAMEKLRSQSGMASESATTFNLPVGDQPELDEYGKQYMKNLGIAPEDYAKVAARLAKG